MTKVCIARSNKFSFSETFIDNQIKNIKHDFLIYGGWKPYIELKNGSFFTGLLKLNIIRGFIKKNFPFYYENIYEKSLSNFFIKNKIKIILANYGIIGVNLLKASKKNNIKLIVHFHGFDISHIETLEKYKESYLELFNYSSKIISVSNLMTKNLILAGADAHKIIKIPYGVDINLFKGANPRVAKKKIYYVGRLAAKKAPLTLINSFNEVLKIHNDAELNIIGDGELYIETFNYTKYLKIEDKIIFHGKQNPDYIVSELKKAKIFVQHSVVAPNGDSEGTPNTILEASSMGLPIVSTRHAGISEAVIENKTGFLVDEHDYIGMAQKICLLLNNNDLCEEFGKNGRLHIIENYNITNQSKKLENILFE